MRRRGDDPLVAAARRVGVSDPRVLAAVAAVPRDRFVPPAARREAVLDRPVRIGEGQTTSQPSLIAAMLAEIELTGTERVLEVGTGFGYQTALLAHLAGEVHSIERFAGLAAQARANLTSYGLGDVDVVVGDGTRGLPDHAPFDAIVVSAAAEEVPAALGSQLVEGGRLIAPVGPPGAQEVWLYVCRSGELVPVRRLTAVRFVPLVAGDDPT
ncbi:protein-L-isoaspartate(D-aspartate) O-methyltransferase [Nitriliruptor alkaliphilus]|uniref:protein-L-isoaspartate(D-aspartate) O-methyltransferase n=1 Tax=Nitriliruptor alkaliphilus TaxID=427918 RepID=UPI000697393F|nr:protein-L-isoaspartate(D-aspartate) O-methyltransferase [Nitriliruptor alkaliphilus]